MVRQLVNKYPNKHITISKITAYYTTDSNKLRIGYETYVEDIKSDIFNYLTYQQLTLFVKELLK